MLRTGRVISALDGKIEVCFDRPEACEHCGACTGQKGHTLVVIESDAPLGCFVDVDMPAAQVLKASLMAYVIPLAMLLLGIALGSVLFQQEYLWAILGILFMLASWGILRLIESGLKKKEIWQPRVVKVYPEGVVPEVMQ